MISSIAPEPTNRIPDASNGGIISITIFITRNLDPQRIDNETSTISIFGYFNAIICFNSIFVYIERILNLMFM
jgi:hypothetical protein